MSGTPQPPSEAPAPAPSKDRRDRMMRIEGEPLAVLEALLADRNPGNSLD